MSKKPQFQICVSGAARGGTVNAGHNLAFDLGVAIAKSGHTLLTGATVGLPNRAAEGVKSVDGTSVGISPAATRLEHEKKYHLPSKSYDTILFTGLHYVGRDSLLIASADAVIFVGGRIGTLHEFAICMEMHKPAGVLMGAGGTSEEFEGVMKAAGIHGYAAHNVVFGDKPTQVVKSIETLLRERVSI